MKEDVEMTELALAFPLFGDADKTGKRHQVKCSDLLNLVIHYISTLYLQVVV